MLAARVARTIDLWVRSELPRRPVASSPTARGALARQLIARPASRGILLLVAERQSKSARTRQRILDAAAEVFCERGYTDTRLTDIAARAEMHVGGLYYYFESREDLVREILRLGVQRSWDLVAEAVATLPPTATPLERLEEALRAQTLATVGLSKYASAQARMAGQIPIEISTAHRREVRDYGLYWHSLLQVAQDAGQIPSDTDLFVARMIAFGAMNWTSEWFKPSDEMSAELLADQMARSLIRGIVTGEKASTKAQSSKASRTEPN